MGTLYLVRHGQASFGAADYDQLSPLGVTQCEALGAWMRARGLLFEAVLRGSLRRHQQSLAGIERGLGGPLPAQEWPGLNEYDSAALVQALPAAQQPPDFSALSHRDHFRLLRLALAAWMAGETQPQGMPSWRDFEAGVVAALDHVRLHAQGPVLMVSSGGPIATAVAHVLQAPASSVIELNLRIRNSALTEMAFTPKRHMLVSYNALPHLDAPERADWVTYA